MIPKHIFLFMNYGNRYACIENIVKKDHVHVKLSLHSSGFSVFIEKLLLIYRLNMRGFSINTVCSNADDIFLCEYDWKNNDVCKVLCFIIKFFEYEFSYFLLNK